MQIDDSNKASFGLTPTTVRLDTSVYDNGCYADSANTIATMLKWDKHSYPDIWGYVVWVWVATPSWYSGDIVYPACRGSSAATPFTQTMLDTMLKYEFLDGADTTSYTIKGLTPDTQYMVAVSAFTNEGEQYAEDVCYTDVYILTFTAEVDSATFEPEPQEPDPKINDSNKASFGLTPTTVRLDTSVYDNGCYADSANTIATMLKWDKHSYPDIWGYVVWVWVATPSWYSGDIVYPACRGDSAATPFTQTMLDTMLKYEFLDGADTTSYTIKGLTPDTQYMVAVSAFTNEGEQYEEDVCYSDVYILKFTAEVDAEAPKIISAVLADGNKIKIDWSRYAGYDNQGYTLYVWTKRPDWHQGEFWYPTRSNSAVASMIINSAAFSITTGVELNTVTIDKDSNVDEYYFGVVARLQNGITDMYIVHLYLCDTWKWIPRGEINQSIDWGTNTIDFETGAKQHQQKFVKPVRIVSATFSGRAKTWYEIKDFIDAHKGNLLPFFLWIDEYDRKIRYSVRLADSKYNPKFQTEVVRGASESGLARHLHIGFTIDLTFLVEKEAPIFEEEPVEEEPVELGVVMKHARPLAVFNWLDAQEYLSDDDTASDDDTTSSTPDVYNDDAKTLLHIYNRMYQDAEVEFVEYTEDDVRIRAMNFYWNSTESATLIVAKWRGDEKIYSCVEDYPEYDGSAGCEVYSIEHFIWRDREYQNGLGGSETGWGTWDDLTPDMFMIDADDLVLFERSLCYCDYGNDIDNTVCLKFA